MGHRDSVPTGNSSESWKAIKQCPPEVAGTFPLDYKNVIKDLADRAVSLRLVREANGRGVLLGRRVLLHREAPAEHHRL